MGRARVGTFIQYRMETQRAPPGGVVGIDTETGRFIGRESVEVVHRHRIRTAVEPFVGRQIQLTGCIVTTVAYDTTLIQDRLYLLVEGDMAGSRNLVRGHDPIPGGRRAVERPVVGD